MKIQMWEAAVAAHKLMGLLLEERLTEPRDIRAKMHETDPFREMALDDRDQVIELAWYLSLSPFDGVFKVLGQAPSIPRRDSILDQVAGQRRALERILRETAKPGCYENHPYDLPSDLREMLLRYSTTKPGYGNDDQLRPGRADLGNSRPSAREK